MFIGDHNLAVGTNIKLTADSLTFTCTTDGNTAQKTYPRASGTGANAGTPDPAYNTALAIVADGVSSTATGATYNPADGVLVITQNSHGFVVGIRLGLLIIHYPLLVQKMVTIKPKHILVQLILSLADG